MIGLAGLAASSGTAVIYLLFGVYTRGSKSAVVVRDSGRVGGKHTFDGADAPRLMTAAMPVSVFNR